MKLRLLAALPILFCSSLEAATHISYSASASPSSDPDSGSTNVWTTSTPNGTAGYFLGNSGANGDGNGAGAGNPAWGMYANPFGDVYSTHTFDGGALTVGQKISMDFDNGGVNGGATVGIKLFNGITHSFEFFFQGGQTNYRYSDASSNQDTFAGHSDDGGIFSFTLNSETTYSASYRGATWNGTIASITSVPITEIQVYNIGAGSGSSQDLFFNNLSVVPEPTNALAGLLAGVGMLMRKRRNH